MMTKSLRYLILAFAVCCGTLAAMAQENTKTVTGSVTDAATGKPLQGVIVPGSPQRRRL